jgi:hypothetical protein
MLLLFIAKMFSAYHDYCSYEKINSEMESSSKQGQLLKSKKTHWSICHMESTDWKKVTIYSEALSCKQMGSAFIYVIIMCGCRFGQSFACHSSLQTWHVHTSNIQVNISVKYYFCGLLEV